ncbi:hypothetical protein P3T76_009551 [Phytophthora citrophthora]|uniref:Uncharacterized protein n=1 Tax=Phytophthora citrophthora TaxID=4793 RepID=A0AAD9GG20_9STRA|nr:hypothetical protein P3T76_009551 [Phytophthora citrophthora]
MRSRILQTLESTNIQLNTSISRHAWVGWLFIYLSELLFFSVYRLTSLSLLVKVSATPEDGTTVNRIFGVLLGIVQDFVVISFLVLVLCGFDAVINRLVCCNDTAPNGCMDCFTRGIPFRSRIKLVLKRIVRLSVIYAACVLSVALFAVDLVVIQSYHRRYEFGWSFNKEQLVVSSAQERITTIHVLIIVLVSQGLIAIVTMVWFDLTRWTPLQFATRWSEELPTLNSQPPVNYLVMDSDDFFDADDSENLSSFFDSTHQPIRGTQQPQPTAILSDDRRDLPPPRWKFVVFGIGLAAVVFIGITLLVLLITSSCPPSVASIALNSNLNEPTRVITTLSFVPT